MQVSIELLLGIGLALGVPLLAGIAAMLWQIRATLNNFTQTIDKAMDSMEKTLHQRIDLLEERIRM